MPKAEETLASYLSPESASSLKAPGLPTRPLKNTSALVGKAYSAAGQAAACLHTMAIMQAYQADLLKEVCEGGEISADTINELRQTADLSLRATKETAKSIGRSMAALVATERHLWLSQTSMKEKDKSLLLNSPISPAGLFGDALHSVTERFQEEKKQAAAFHKFIPLKIRVQSGAAERGQSHPPSSSSRQRTQQIQSVASRAPPQRGWRDETGRSQTRSSRGRADLRTVIVAKKAASKRS